MKPDKSILLRMEERGVAAPRVALRGTVRSDAAVERYEILGEIARGGVGVVHRGHDNDIGRDVALKVLHERHLDSPDLVQRFVEEAQIGGQLQHPGIVPVYELGLGAGERPFFAMKLVKGDTLAVRLSGRSHPSEGGRALLAVFREVCRTMAYSHARGVIHRDLKPSNVMIGNFGEVQVVDWGFAKVMRKGGAADDDLTHKAERQRTLITTVRSGEGSAPSIAGSVMGTPAYMPPEQALGRVEDLDEKSDLFSLGAILCEILTGDPPYTGSDTDRLTAAAQARLGPALERLEACDADERLVALCTRCLEPLPKDRPGNARFLADEVAEYLARAEGRAHRAELRALKAKSDADGQRQRRQQAILVSIGVLAVLLVAVGAFLLIDAGRSERATERRRAIDAALLDATRLRAAGDWSGALASAERAIELGHDGMLAVEIRKEAAAANEAARREAEDDAFLAELEEIRARLGQGDVESPLLVVLGPGGSSRSSMAVATATEDERRDADVAYAAAFERRFGSVAESVDRLRRSRHAAAFAANLGFWAWLRRSTPALAGSDWKPLDRLARAMDPGHDEVRDAIISKDVPALAALAEAQWETISPGLGARVGMALTEWGRAREAVALLTRLQRRHPADFWVNMRLAHAAAALGNHDLAARHYSAAIAIRPTHATAHERLSSSLDALGDLEGALAACRRAAALAPNSSQVHTALGALLANRFQRFEEAIESFERALEDGPSNVVAQNNIGIAYLRLGELDASIAAFRRAIEIEPEFLKARSFLAVSLARRGDVDEALAVIEKALEVDPGCAWTHCQLGVMLCDHLKRYDEAIAAFRRALELDPELATAQVNLGVALRGKGELDAALAAHRRAVEMDPDLADAHGHLGLTLKMMGDVGSAIAEYRKALELDPHHLQVLTNLGLVLTERGELDEAIALLRKAAGLPGALTETTVALGAALLRAGDQDAAIEAYRAGLQRVPRHVGLLLGLGAALREKPEFDAALEVLERVHELAPDHPLLHYNLAAVHLGKGELDEACTAIRRSIELDPGYPYSYTLLGAIRVRQGDQDGAMRACRRAIALDGEQAYAHQALGKLLLNRNELEDAIVAFRRALELDRDLPDSREGLGVALLFSEGRLDEAIAELRRAIELDASPASYHGNLGWALLGKGELEEAIAEIRTALRIDPTSARHEALLQTAQRWVKARELLPAAVAGEHEPADWREALDLASQIRLSGRDPAVAVRFYRRVFEERPDVADGRNYERYNGACVAALAGDDAQALGWLRAEIDSLSALLESRPRLVARTLAHWKRDPDLTSIRDADDLPEAFRQLWSDVDALLKHAEELAK